MGQLGKEYPCDGGRVIVETVWLKDCWKVWRNGQITYANVTCLQTELILTHATTTYDASLCGLNVRLFHYPSLNTITMLYCQVPRPADKSMRRVCVCVCPFTDRLSLVMPNNFRTLITVSPCSVLGLTHYKGERECVCVQ